MGICSRKCSGIAISCVGAIIVIVMGVLGWVFLPKIVDNKIKDETTLMNEETRNKWENVTVPIQLRFYIYNITNPDGIEDGEKLQFEERGPYVYNEVRTKITEFSDDLSSVTYRQTIFYYFDPEASIGDESDVFNIPNIPFISAAHAGYARRGGQDIQLQLLIRSLSTLAKEKIVKTNVNVGEILFKGWKLPAQYNLIPPIERPPDFAGLRFGLYRFKNGTDDGEYVINTGEDNHEEFGEIMTWEGEPELDYWFTKGLNETSEEHYCNKINGSDGSIFPPFMGKDTTLRIFQTDICRSIHLTFNSETVYKDIDAYKFTIPFEMLQNPACNGNNKCFCPRQSPRLAHHCTQSLIRIFPCKHGAPIVTSQARFLDAADEVFDAIEAERPDRELHETFLEVEPRSGMLLRASKKVQINVELQPLANLAQFGDLDFTKVTDSPTILLPVVWAEELAELSSEDADELYDKLIKPLKIINIVKWVVVGVGILFTVVGLFVAFS